MRLSSDDAKGIKTVILNADPRAKVYLFGSRTDDAKKGGDIDLLVLSTSITIEDEIKIKLALYDILDEQKIDLIVAKDTKRPFVSVALKEGIEL